jgi:hypothetical protein
VKRDEDRDDLLRFRRGCKDVHVPDRLLAPPDRSCEAYLPGDRKPGELIEDRFGFGKDLPQEVSPQTPGLLPEGEEDIPLALLAKARKVSDLSCPCRLFELVEAGDPEEPAQEQGFFRPDTLEISELTDPFGDLCLKTVEVREPAGAEDLVDLCREVSSHARDLFEFPLFVDSTEFLGKVLGTMGCPPVRNRFELHAFLFEKIGHFVQYGSDLPVVHPYRWIHQSIPGNCGGLVVSDN